MEKVRVAMAMSGGVDSSAAAAILKEKGFDLVGFTMQLWDHRRSIPAGDDYRSGCGCPVEHLHDAREVAARLGIPHYVVDFRKEFEHTIVRNFIESYRMGLTPSPCVQCNSLMKFSHLFDMAKEAQTSRIATGHYARVSYDEKNGRHLLLRACDRDRDQSYFLFELSQSQLAMAMFPLGNLEKDQVRAVARKYNLPVAEKRDSQEICFIPDGDYAAFIERYYDEIVGSEVEQPFPPGPIIDTEGRMLGTHSGIHHYTIGQRRGLGIAHASPLYVLELHPDGNTVVVGERSRLGRRRCRVEKINWISIPRLIEPLRVWAKIRSRHEAAPAAITPLDNENVEVIFETPQSSITPGQACVFFQGDVVLGGGWIARFIEENHCQRS
ncbi:MAG: tRNA 2-thiouridine(34) synthase MnmA [Acidobacteria bacterium]|nr:tRNA 2-thiouridine(34) synthase MnmA [Acidobacteriota bacterium]